MEVTTPSDRIPPNYQWVVTEDGSWSLFSEAFDETCHSTTGARAETVLHYVKGCEIEKQLSSKDALTILEVGFGTGLGFLTTIEELRELSKPLHFVSLEIDPVLVHWFLERHPNFFNESRWEKNIFRGSRDHITLTVITLDARVALPAYLNDHPLKWDAIYQDAFSPKKNPVLWTVEWFILLREHANLNVLMSTYSASSSIRKSMVEAGWQLSKGEKFGPKRTSTRAKLTGESDPEILLQLDRSPVEAYTDLNIQRKP